jgi:hypothetical protein
MRYLTIRKFSSESGYTEAAVRSKIQDGTWLEDRVWRRAPDRRILIDVEGYEAWVETGVTSKPLRHVLLRPASQSVGLRHGGSSRSPEPLI